VKRNLSPLGARSAKRHSALRGFAKEKKEKWKTGDARADDEQQGRRSIGFMKAEDANVVCSSWHVGRPLSVDPR
jgi:hypothetical protein